MPDLIEQIDAVRNALEAVIHDQQTIAAGLFRGPMLPRALEALERIAAQLDAARPVSVEDFLSDLITLYGRCEAVPVGEYSQGYSRGLEAAVLIFAKHFPNTPLPHGPLPPPPTDPTPR